MEFARSMAEHSHVSMAQTQAHGHMTPSMGQYPQDTHLVSPGAVPASYRTANGYTSTTNPRGYYPGPEWTDAYGADGSVDYGMNVSQYQVINDAPVHMSVSYGEWAQPRQRSTGGQSSSSSSVYLDPDAAGYVYGAGSTTNLVHRPAVPVAGDTSAYSFSSIAASLPATTHERLLPTPISRALGSSSSSSSYRPGDTLASLYFATKSGHGSSAPGGGTGQTSPVSPISEAAAAAAVVSYAGAAYDYANSARSSQHHGGGGGGGSAADAYATVPPAADETIFGDSERNAAAQGSAVDLATYAYAGGGDSPADSSSMRRGSSSGSGLTPRSAGGGDNNNNSSNNNGSGAGSAGYGGPTERGTSSAHAPASHGSGSHSQQQQQQPSSSSLKTHGHHHHQQRYGNSQQHPHYHHASSRHPSPRHGHGGHHAPQ